VDFCAKQHISTHYFITYYICLLFGTIALGNWDTAHEDVDSAFLSRLAAPKTGRFKHTDAVVS
jgi:hypothetical protein